MPKLSVSGLKPMPIKGDHFYDNEILSDFQVRQKAILKEIESVSADAPHHVGMPTINPKTNAEKYLVEYASASTVHGLNHLVAPHRHYVEKFLALLFIGGALLCLIFLSFLFWGRYQDNPTVIVVNNNRDRFKIPKPAIFVCPVPNIDNRKISSTFQKHGIKPSRAAEKFFAFLVNANYDNMAQTPAFDEVPPSKWLEILYDLRAEVPLNVLKENDPYETWIVTERGLCIAARSVFAVYATYEYWMSNNWTFVPLPKETLSYDYNNDQSQETVTVKDSVQFTLNDPFEILWYGAPSKWIRPQILDRYIVSISEIKTQEKVRELSVHQRKCKFFNDGGLKTWPVYSQNMCEIECRMQVIEDRCNCRPHFARPMEGVNVCNAMQLRCIGNITAYLFLNEYAPVSCNCVPNCNVVTYQMRDLERTELYEMPISAPVAIMIIEFPQVVYFRLLVYGFTDFVIGVGGAAGLFLGASVLSFVEIFYYLTLRVCFFIKQTRQKSKKKILNTDNLSSPFWFNKGNM